MTGVDALLVARLGLARAQRDAFQRYRGRRLGVEASRILRTIGHDMTRRIRAASLRDHRRLGA